MKLDKEKTNSMINFLGLEALTEIEHLTLRVLVESDFALTRQRIYIRVLSEAIANISQELKKAYENSKLIAEWGDSVDNPDKRKVIYGHMNDKQAREITTMAKKVNLKLPTLFMVNQALENLHKGKIVERRELTDKSKTWVYYLSEQVKEHYKKKLNELNENGDGN